MMKTKKTVGEYNNFNDVYQDAKADLHNYIDRRFRLTKLSAYEKLANLSSRLLYSAIIVVFVFLLVIMSFVTLGLYLGHLFDNNVIGFSSVCFICLIALIITYLLRTKIKNSVVNLTIRTLKKIESDEK